MVSGQQQQRTKNIPGERDSEQCTTSGSNPVDPVMAPVVGSHCRTEGSGRVHTGSRHPTSETTATTYQHCNTAGDAALQRADKEVCSLQYNVDGRNEVMQQ